MEKIDINLGEINEIKDKELVIGWVYADLNGDLNFKFNSEVNLTEKQLKKYKKEFQEIADKIKVSIKFF